MVIIQLVFCVCFVLCFVFGLGCCFVVCLLFVVCVVWGFLFIVGCLFCFGWRLFYVLMFCGLLHGGLLGFGGFDCLVVCLDLGVCFLCLFGCLFVLVGFCW